MKSLKNMLVRTFGVVGYVLWFVLGSLLMFAPLVFLDIPFLVSLLIIAVILYLPVVGDIANLIIWIWAFVVVVSEPIDGWSIAYFIIFAIYALTTIIPAVMGIIASIFDNKYHN